MMPEPGDDSPDSSLTVTRVTRTSKQGEPAVEAWFGTGGRVRFRRTAERGIIAEVWRPTDPDSIYLDYTSVSARDADDTNVDECLTVFLEYMTGSIPRNTGDAYRALAHDPEDEP
jgi:hypothetical protein